MYKKNNEKKAVNHTALKTQNQKLIIEKVKSVGMISRAELSKELKLSAPSVSSNMEELLDKGIVVETGIGQSKGGRRPIVVGYNYDYAYIVGLCLREEGVAGGISNLSGQSLRQYTMKRNLTEDSVDELLSEIEKAVEILVNKAEIPLEKVKAIVISLPGIIENNKVKVSNIFPQLVGDQLFNSLTDKYHVHLTIKNDINTAVVGEYWKMPEKNFNNIIYISPEKTGVGSGIILGGKLYEGNRSGAGEIGYTLLSVDFSLKDKKTELPYLENIVSSNSLLKQVFSLAQKEGGYIKSLTQDKEELMTKEVFRKALKNGDPVAIKFLDLLARYYAVVAHNMIMILNPEVVFFSSTIEEFGDELFQIVKKYIDSVAIVPVDIRLSNLGYMGQVYGCLYFGIKYIEENILSI